MPKKLNVFLCHSSDDKPAVRELYLRLKAEPWIEPWLDEEEIFPGQDWDLEIEKAVEKADAVLVVLSNNSVNKEGYVQRELRMILRMAEMKPEGAIFTIPLRLENCKVPRRVSTWQYVDFFPENRKDWAYKRLLGALKIRAEARSKLQEPSGKLQEANLSEAEFQARIEERARQLALEMAQKAQKEKAEREERERQEKAAKAEQVRIAKEKLEAEERARQLALEMAQKAREEKAQKEKRAAAEKEAEKERAARAANPAGIDWIKIPAGEFIMGSNEYGDEKPERNVYLPDYLIAKTPVTNGWRESEKRIQPYYWTDSNLNTPTQPVVGVSWYEAEAFCAWANCRLPSEAEWEKAARGTDGRKYPWGDQTPSEKLANFNGNLGKTSSVGSYSPAGDSPYGCVDMAGNVWEWCADWYDVYPGGDPKASSDFGEKYKALRGGAWGDLGNYARSAFRFRSTPDNSSSLFGFRCVRSPLS